MAIIKYFVLKITYMYLSIVLWFAFKDDFLTLFTMNYMKWVKQMIASWLDKYKNRGTGISDDSLKILYSLVWIPGLLVP